MKTRDAQVVSAALVLASFAASAYFYPDLPASIVTHWNAAGQANGMMGKFAGVFLLPALTALMAALFFVLPHIDPLKEGYKAFRKEYDELVTLIVAFMVLVQSLVLAWNIGYRFDIGRFIAPGVGVLFYFLGTVMPGIKRNWFAGIRTPWTLSSDRVWNKTHEHAGAVFQLAGILACFGAIFPKYDMWLMLVPIIAATVWVTLYSYLVYRKGA